MNLLKLPGGLETIQAGQESSGDDFTSDNTSDLEFDEFMNKRKRKEMNPIHWVNRDFIKKAQNSILNTIDLSGIEYYI